MEEKSIKSVNLNAEIRKGWLTISNRTMDLLQFVTVYGRERELEDWKELLKRADERFEFCRAWKTEKSYMWFIEAVFK